MHYVWQTIILVVIINFVPKISNTKRTLFAAGGSCLRHPHTKMSLQFFKHKHFAKTKDFFMVQLVLILLKHFIWINYLDPSWFYSFLKITRISTIFTHLAHEIVLYCVNPIGGPQTGTLLTFWSLLQLTLIT